VNSSSRFASDGNSGLQVLWEDGERDFCRGSSNGDDTNLVLAVLLATEHPAPADLDRLAHEYELRGELDAAWATRPLERVRERGQTILLLQDTGGEPLDRLIGPPMGLELFLPLAVVPSAAVDRLHGRGERQSRALPPEFLKGTLAYMAPEQTGRMNRSIDSRRDLHSLGVALYGDAPIPCCNDQHWGPVRRWR
jgi:serine/threonine protein kinase